MRKAHGTKSFADAVMSIRRTAAKIFAAVCEGKAVIISG
jgi:hypothetical protein